MSPVKDRFCSFCGAAYPEPLVYPRACVNAACGVKVWSNPIPVCVVLAPVRDGDRVGLLALRRGIEPRRGMLALPGGFLEDHESWQAGGAREVREEVDVVLDAATLRPFWYASSAPKPNRVLLFSVAAEIALASLPPFTPNLETFERGVVWGPEGLDEVFAFPLHAEAARRWFASERITGEHAWEQR
jgi:ADP-ribose pyrophosphatase YjhB (NUDIX family)